MLYKENKFCIFCFLKFESGNCRFFLIFIFLVLKFLKDMFKLNKLNYIFKENKNVMIIIKK